VAASPRLDLGADIVGDDFEIAVFDGELVSTELIIRKSCGC
jgi:hypothetical protein